MEASGPQPAHPVISGAGGDFRLDHLTPGVYRLKYTMPAYFGSDIRGAAPVTVKGPASVESVALEMTPVARLEGAVLDEEGRPLEGVLVYTGTNYQTTTTADGRYTIERLQPGSYVIVLRTPYTIRRNTRKRDPETGEIFGYANTEFYPGVAEAQAAIPVAVAAGLDLRNFDIRLRRVHLVELSGRAMERAGGEPLPGARVELVANNVISPLNDETYKDRALAEDGGFRFDLIQPGSYTLLVYRAKEMKGALPFAEALEVGKTGLEDVKVAVPPFAAIQGSILVPPDTEWNGQLIFAIRSPIPGVATREFTVNTSRFVIEDLPPGKWVITVDSARAGPARLLLQSARFGVQDSFTEPLTVTESGNPPFEIRLGAESGRIAGTVTDSGGLPRKNTIVAVSRFGTRIAMSFTTVERTRDDGTFLVEGLAPGTYRIIFIDPSRQPVFNTVLNEVKVEVRTGETTVVRLQ